MENAVDLVFTEAYLMPKKHYEFLAKVSMETEEGEPQKDQVCTELIWNEI